jgi:hypothetical protein
MAVLALPTFAITAQWKLGMLLKKAKIGATPHYRQLSAKMARLLFNK